MVRIDPVYVRIECTDVLSFFEYVKSMKPRDWAFRGHAKFAENDSNDWKVESTLNRFLRTHRPKINAKLSWYPRERDQLNRFRASAHSHLSHLPEERDVLSWLALMQHYGAPTRLIDFTFNPTVALFFALRGAGPTTGPFSIHALHIDTIRGRAQVVRKALAEYSNSTPPLNPKPKEYCIGSKPKEIDFVGFFDGSQLNPRQENQEGLFLVPSRIDLDVEYWMHNHLTPNKTIKPHNVAWVEFVFLNQSSVYYDCVQQMLQAGMSAKRLFPGLEGVCESMKYSWLSSPKNLKTGD
jgi:hypothetical protein